MSTGTVTSLDDLEDGQHLALTINGTTSRWTWSEGVMVNQAGRRVEPWFFSGAVDKGRLVLADFRPPQVNEWFRQAGRDNHFYLVVDTDGEEKLNSPIVARFSNGRWITFTQAFNMIDTYQRCERPEWANDTVVTLTVSAYGLHLEKEAMSSRVRQLNDARTYMNYARDYINNAISSLEPR